MTQRTSCSGFESETRISEPCTIRHGRSTTPACCSTTSPGVYAVEAWAEKTICGLIAANQLRFSSLTAAAAANAVLSRRHTCPKWRHWRYWAPQSAGLLDYSYHWLFIPRTIRTTCRPFAPWTVCNTKCSLVFFVFLCMKIRSNSGLLNVTGCFIWRLLNWIQAV